MDVKEKETDVAGQGENKPGEIKRKKKPFKKPSKKLIFISAAALLIVAAAFFVPIILRSAAGNNPEPQMTVPLHKTDISSNISVSGVVKSAETTNIYSNQSAYPIAKINVKVGDAVKAGDVLAELDMSKLQNDITQTELNLENAEANAKEDERSRSNSITNAKTSLESSQIALAKQQLSTANAEKELAKAEAEMNEPFDSYSYDLAIGDAKTAMDRKAEDLAKAEKDLDDALYNFDDYTYQNTIREAGITLDRRRADLDDAESKLNDEINSSQDRFDDYNYLNAIDAARRAYNNVRDSYNSGSTATSLSQVEEAQYQLDKAINDYNNALDKHNRSAWDARNSKIESAQTAVDNAQRSYDDALRSYNKAHDDLDRAMRDAAENAYDALVKAQNAMEDAQKSYEKALSDKGRAINDYIDKNKTALENAQKTAADSQKQLQSAQNSLKSAQNSLNQASAKPDASGTNVMLQELNLDKLNNQLAEGKIVATADGVITEMNAKVGANPSGILFVIEDTDNLYVSARIKEYNLASISIDQSAVVTADATGDKIYDGYVSYISPKAVSEAGSTSVEFEIQANIKNSDNAIKIGMNAFLNIVTDSKSNVFVVPLSMITTDPRGSFVFALVDGETKEIPVTIGLKTSTSAEISGSDLVEGMQLLVDPMGSMTTRRTSNAFGGPSFSSGGPSSTVRVG